MTHAIAIVDCETTGLDPDRHEVWEVAVIIAGVEDEEGKAPADCEYLWQLPVQNLDDAEPAALSLSRFYERRWPTIEPSELDGSAAGKALDGYRDGPDAIERVLTVAQMPAWAWRFAELTAGLPLVGANPSFDARRLDDLIRRYDASPAWHYRLLDIESMAAGYVLGRRSLLEQEDIAHLIKSRPTPATVPRHPVSAPPLNTGAFPLPWASLRTVAGLVGVSRASRGRHTALEDCRWVRDIWRRIVHAS